MRKLAVPGTHEGFGSFSKNDVKMTINSSHYLLLAFYHFLILPKDIHGILKCFSMFTKLPPPHPKKTKKQKQKNIDVATDDKIASLHLSRALLG